MADKQTWQAVFLSNMVKMMNRNKKLQSTIWVWTTQPSKQMDFFGCQNKHQKAATSTSLFFSHCFGISAAFLVRAERNVLQCTQVLSVPKVYGITERKKKKCPSIAHTFFLHLGILPEMLSWCLFPHIRSQIPLLAWPGFYGAFGRCLHDIWLASEESCRASSTVHTLR